MLNSVCALLQEGTEATLDYVLLEAYRLLYEAMSERAPRTTCQVCWLAEGTSPAEALRLDGRTCPLLYHLCEMYELGDRTWTVVREPAQLRLIE
jgi:hypothetical protein